MLDRAVGERRWRTALARAPLEPRVSVRRAGSCRGSLGHRRASSRWPRLVGLFRGHPRLSRRPGAPRPRCSDQLPRGLRQSPCGRIAEGVIPGAEGTLRAGSSASRESISGRSSSTWAGCCSTPGAPRTRSVHWRSSTARPWAGSRSMRGARARDRYVRAAALDRLGRRAEALAVATEQLRIWARADAGNPALRRMRELASRLRARAHGRHVSGPRPEGQDHGQGPGCWPGPSGAVLPPLASRQCVALEVSVHAPTGR